MSLLVLESWNPIPKVSEEPRAAWFLSKVLKTQVRAQPQCIWIQEEEGTAALVNASLPAESVFLPPLSVPYPVVPGKPQVEGTLGDRTVAQRSAGPSKWQPGVWWTWSFQLQVWGLIHSRSEVMQDPLSDSRGSDERDPSCCESEATSTLSQR